VSITLGSHLPHCLELRGTAASLSNWMYRLKLKWVNAKESKPDDECWFVGGMFIHQDKKKGLGQNTLVLGL